ncbi:dynein light chain roadblock-type 1-like [Sipha flava]|uniref:Dynein light chain roadblock n=1 Tax=Sipha flava TaxID=143950 RepID=A0A2S2PWX2_9HEMI|nr:dynein light chain roadblock-type 1-like [Sipha flava]XP_025413282.1 dynein light chain roadblock-type 1-like [Sipha flava]
MANQLEETLKRIQSSDGVEGFIVLNNDGVPIKSTIEHSTAVRYSGMIQMLIGPSKQMHKQFNAKDELKSMRLRTKKKEIIIVLDKLYTMIVIQNPTGAKPPI